MTPTNRTDEVARQRVADFVFRKFGHACDGKHPKWHDCGTCECVEQVLEFTASAITSAVEQERAKLERIAEHRLKCAVEAERERCAKAAENGLAYSSGIEIATAIRQTPTKEGV